MGEGTGTKSVAIVLTLILYVAAGLCQLGIELAFNAYGAFRGWHVGWYCGLTVSGYIYHSTHDINSPILISGVYKEQFQFSHM